VINISTEIPTSLQLIESYPNPFNPLTTIKYSLPADGVVSVKIYDILGNEADALIGEYQKAGTYEVTWNGEGKASGMYLCVLQSGGSVQVVKLMLMK
jgi:hypothetical protein